MQLVIEPSRIRHNLRRIRAAVCTRIIAVVKADAYAHGVAIAPYIEPVVDAFMTATRGEAENILASGVNKPVLVMGGDVSEIAACDARIIPTVSTAKDVETCLFAGCKRFSVAVNTGMNRLGAGEAELKRIASLCESRGVRPYSVYSHIYGGMSSAAKQAEEFDRLTSARVFSGFRHLYSSCALDLTGSYMFDAVRCGIAMYGYHSGMDTALKARARIVAISRVSRGSHVGYGDFVLDRDATVATVRCGYADGLRRTDVPLYLKVRGKKCRVLGVSCMDLTMIDVSDAPCRVGEYAYLISDREDAEYLAKAYGTIVYEVLTGLNGRAQRFYI